MLRVGRYRCGDVGMWGCLVPKRLSLDENMRAKEGRKETTTAVCTLPMVPCGSSPVARHYLAKNEAAEEEAGMWGRTLSLRRCVT